MDCDTAREALSARIDGEREPIPGPVSTSISPVARHVATGMPPRSSRPNCCAPAGGPLPTRRGRTTRGRTATWSVVAGSISWRRWALGGIGVIQLGLALAQGLERGPGYSARRGGGMCCTSRRPGRPPSGRDAGGGGPAGDGRRTGVGAGGLAVFLALYEIIDTDGPDHDRPAADPFRWWSAQCWRCWCGGRIARTVRPDRTRLGDADDIVLPDNALSGPPTQPSAVGRRLPA